MNNATSSTQQPRYRPAAFAVALVVTLTATFCLSPREHDLRTTSEPAAAKLARGTYLAHSVTACVDCHTPRDFSRYSGPPVLGADGQGGGPFTRAMGIPGVMYARNITAAALGDRSDEEILRALTQGWSTTGDALFPLMPYPQFAGLCRADLEAILAWVRSLPPIENTVPARELDIPWDSPIGGAPRPLALREECPDPKDTVAYGKYLLDVASCHDCHTPQDQNGRLPGRLLAGGVSFDIPELNIYVSTGNITPDEETGIGSWSRARFIGRFKAFANPASVPVLGEGDAQTIMPWTVYAGMTEEDLGAIYDYLRTVAPVKNAVVRFRAPPATVGPSAANTKSGS